MADALLAARETVVLVKQAVVENDFKSVFKLFDDLYNLPLRLVRFRDVFPVVLKRLGRSTFASSD